MRRKALAALLPVALIAIAIGVSTRGGDEVPPGPVAISAVSPTFSSLADMTETADTVVIARVVDVRPGRPLSAPDSATPSLRTQLTVLQVGDVLHGVAPEQLMVEEESALADGRAVTVNGMHASRAGDEGVYFLAAGATPQFPHYAVVNEQGRYLVDGPIRDQLATSSVSVLSRNLATLGPFELRCQVLLAGNTGRDCRTNR